MLMAPESDAATLVPHRSAEKKRTTQTPAAELARLAVDGVLSKKAHDVVVMDMRHVSGIADFFIVCTGDSDLQVRAIADATAEQVREATGEKPWHVEGTDHWQWVLVDFVDVVVHVFNPEKRLFYAIERLWGDAPIEEVAETASGADVRLLKPGAPAPSAPAPAPLEENAVAEEGPSGRAAATDEPA